MCTACKKAYGITLDWLRSDLERGCPLYILSFFSPGNADVLVQLIGSLPMVQSVEELCLQYHIADTAGIDHEAVGYYFPSLPSVLFMPSQILHCCQLEA